MGSGWTRPIVNNNLLPSVPARRGEAGARLMVVSSSRAESVASVDRMETILKNSRARLIVQHDPDDFASLPVTPAYLD